jgi:hypothetical protein
MTPIDSDAALRGHSNIEPAEAVKSYHADLATLRIRPQHALADGLHATLADRGD